MTSSENHIQVVFDPEYIRNLGARAAAVANRPGAQHKKLVVQDMRWILYRGLYRMFSERPLSVRPAALGWSDGLSDAILTQGRRVAGVLTKDAKPETPDSYGPAFLSLRGFLKARLGDLPKGINDEIAFNEALVLGYATTAETPSAIAQLAALDLEYTRQGSLLEANTLVERAENQQ